MTEDAKAAGESQELAEALARIGYAIQFCRSLLAQRGPNGPVAAVAQVVIDYLTGEAVPKGEHAEEGP